MTGRKKYLWILLGMLLFGMAGCAGQKQEPDQMIATDEPVGSSISDASEETIRPPMALLDYLAVDLSKAVRFTVGVNHSEYGEPTQVFDDEKTVRAAAEAAGQIEITGESDNIGSTGTYYVFSFYDASDELVTQFCIQDNMLMGKNGRYPVSGLDAMFAIDGVIYDWDAYWEEHDSYGEEEN